MNNNIENYGFLRVNTRTGSDALPIYNATITVLDNEGNELYKGTSNQNGFSDLFQIATPSVWTTLDPNTEITPYSTVTVEAVADGFRPIRVNGVQIFHLQNSILRLYMLPQNLNDTNETAEWEIIDVPPPGLRLPPRMAPEFPPDLAPYDIEHQYIQIPEYITVHLGAPNDTEAKNIRIKFTDYIKNVVASELYPTFPYDSLITGIHVAVSLALNRLNTNWYRARGYDFDITSSPDYDQYYRYGGNNYQNINELVEEYFDIYMHRTGQILPFFPVFCNGTTQTCDGLSIWGMVEKANRGERSIDILQDYYGDVILTRSPSIEGMPELFSGVFLRYGGRGDEVLRLQEYLNVIANNYPLIPRIESPNGVFGTSTDNAVRAFQQAFNLASDGAVGKYTWNRLMKIYLSVLRLNQLYRDYFNLEYRIGKTPPDIVLRQGDRGEDVRNLQYMLNFISLFNHFVTPELPAGIFGPSTRASVINFQKAYNLPPTGVVDAETWQKLYDVYLGVPEKIKIPLPEEEILISDYPGYVLSVGSSGEDVIHLQEHLHLLSLVYPDIPFVTINGIYDDLTRVAVLTFQNMFLLPPTGEVDEDTWNRIALEYELILRENAR